MLKERVIDGTPCSPDKYDICVNGKCLVRNSPVNESDYSSRTISLLQSAGCDGILSSNLTLDSCGKCGGDNSSCHEIKGHFRQRSVTHGYNSVVTIPRGASSIEILKTNSPDSWLAIRAEDGSFLLNG